MSKIIETIDTCRECPHIKENPIDDNDTEYTCDKKGWLIKDPKMFPWWCPLPDYDEK